VIADPYYRWAASEYLPPRAAAGRSQIFREDLERELRARVPATLTGPTVNRYARNILTALRDNGYLAGGVKKSLASPPVSAETLGFALYLMAEAGLGTQGFETSPLGACLLKPHELLIPVFLEGQRSGYWDFMGDTAHLQVHLHYRGLAPWLEALP
jgi:hypothetical protein